MHQSTNGTKTVVWNLYLLRLLEYIVLQLLISDKTNITSKVN